MLTYILVRLFTHKKHEFVEGDELRYMACARNFYKLWNKSFYDTHPPLYSWLIKRVMIFIRDYYAGIVVSFLCSIGLYFACSKLYDVLGLTVCQKAVAMAFITFNYTLIYYSNRVFRYQLIALLGTLTILFSLLYTPILSGISWGLLSITCVFAGLRGFFIWLLLDRSLLSVVIWLFFFGDWLVTKNSTYCKHDYYPAGIDGKIEPVKDFTFKQLISPLYFPYTYSYYGKRELGYDFKNWHKKIGGVFGFYQIGNKKIDILLGILTAVLGFFTIKGMVKAPLSLVILTVILLYPSIFKRFLPRNSIIAIPLIGYFLGKGVPQMLLEWLFLGQIGLLVAFLAFNKVFILSQPKIKATVTSRYLDNLSKDGVLVEGLISYPIVYRSRKRIVVIPHEPDIDKAIKQVDLSIEKFDLHYAVFSDIWKTEEYLGYPAIYYIKSFKLIKTIKEDGDNYYVYEIPINQPA